jgi:hypothetical protein
MDAFAAELMRRSPLAGSVLEMSDFVLNDALLDAIFHEHRGRCYEDELRFPTFIRLLRDALLRHEGSGHQLFVQLERKGKPPIDESNFYRKLARTPVEISRALVRECSMRLKQLMPRDACPLPACFDAWVVIAGDGKKIKNATKRLKPTRGYAGALLGAKALVAMDVRNGLALAMSDSLDGEANDVPLVPALMQQVRQVIAEPVLSIWDRQFGGVATLDLLAARAGDAYLVRLSDQPTFVRQSIRQSRDGQGREILDEIGLLFTGKNTRLVRRITLVRAEDEADVQLVTNLLDQDRYPMADLLELYRKRWGIEQVFQQVTETFSLKHLIGCSPKAILLQFSICLLLYDMMQVIKSYVAEDGRVLADAISMFYLFDDVRQELQTWAYHTDGSWPRADRNASAMQTRLRELLKGSWDPVAYRKASDNKPRSKPKPKRPIPGGHTSVQRLLEANRAGAK